MKLFVRAHQMPARLATGAYILNSGLSKRHADDKTAAGVHGMAATAYPFLKEIDPVTFTRLLARAEIGIGAALMLPFVPSALAGAALAGFSGGLLGLYLRMPGMRIDGTLRPSQEGIGLAKDVWMFGIAAGLLAEELGGRRGRSDD